MKARSFPRIDRTYQIEDGILTERIAFGLWPQRPRRIGLSNTTVDQPPGFLTANVKITGNAGDEMVCIGLLRPKRFVDALEEQIRLGSATTASEQENSTPQMQSYAAARRRKEAHFGLFTPNPVGSEPIRYETPMGTYVDNRNGTVTLEERGFTWIRAPWGMTYDNGTFTGEPILMSWGQATDLFGQGQYANGPWGGGTKQDTINASAARHGFKRGRCKVRFAGNDDWRLVTMEELDCLGVYGGPEKKFDLEWGWRTGTAHASIFSKLFPEVAARQEALNIWSANGESSGNAWMFDGSMPPGDFPLKTPAAAILVRNFSPKIPRIRRPAVDIPDRIKLGRKMVVVPGFHSPLFTHAGRVDKDFLKQKQYTWIKRGDVVGRCILPENRGDGFLNSLKDPVDTPVHIVSPVNGLLVHPTPALDSKWPSVMPSITLLVAENEPPPEDSSFSHGAAMRFISKNRDSLYRESPFWSMGYSMTDAQIDGFLQVQKAAQPLTVDAMPEFEDYFEEARTLFPSLRPRLEHLT